MAENNCNTLCCGGFSQTEKTAERVPAPTIRPLDDCNNIMEYFGAVSNDYKFGQPVKPTATPGEVEPALDGVDAIGVSVCYKTSVTGDQKIKVMRTGRICWTDMAANLGLDPTSQADWWPIHVELAKLNIYVEFN